MFVSIWISVEMKSEVVRKNSRPTGRLSSPPSSGQCNKVVEPPRYENKRLHLQQCDLYDGNAKKCYCLIENVYKIFLLKWLILKIAYSPFS